VRGCRWLGAWAESDRFAAPRVYADVVTGKPGQPQQTLQDMLHVLCGLAVLSYAGLCVLCGHKGGRSSR